MPSRRGAIDVAFWFMEDARYTAELIERAHAGVRVRVLMDPRANADLPPERAAAGRTAERTAFPCASGSTSYILHWKMMLFRGQGVVEFSGANYSANALATTPLRGPT